MVDYPDRNQESLDAWESNAEFWDQAQGDDGNHWQRTLVFPNTLELLQPLPATVLELACGNGNFARQLARLGARVTASDASDAQLQHAQQRSDGYRINWMRLDVTDRAALAALSGAAGAPFGAAVCNMALMDIAEITPLFDMLPLALADNAPFVFSVLHPVFRPGPEVRLYRERAETPEGEFIEESGVKITNYLDTRVNHGIAVKGQPAIQPYFDRTLTELFSAAFDRGWVLDGIREPAITDGGAGDAANRLSWDHLPNIPPVMVARLRHRS